MGMVVFSVSGSLSIDLREQTRRIWIGGSGKRPHSRWNEDESRV